MKLIQQMPYLKAEGAFEVLSRAEKLARTGKTVINLGIGQPDFPTPPHIVDAACKALKDGHHGYTPANGILPLREAVSEHIYEYRNVSIDPDKILIVPGGKVTIFFAITMFGEPGAEIMYPDPGFPIYESMIGFSGATPVPIQLYEERGFSFRADEVLDKITPMTRLIIINSPANPTGGVIPREEIERLVAGLGAFPDVAILSDEIYSRMLYDDQDHISLLDFESIRERLILLDGWSKTYAMTGWRIGYSVWPQKLFSHAEKLAINDHSCVNAATQWAAIAALRGSQNHVNKMMSAFNERRLFLTKALNEIPGFHCIKPLGAFYAFPNIQKTGVSAVDLQNRFLDRAGVATIAGSNFGSQGEGYIRFSYANSIDNIREAISRIKKELS